MALLLLPGVVAIALWALSLPGIDALHLGGYGLPPALPVTWYLALFLAASGAVATIVLPSGSRGLMACYVILVGVILFGTVPAVSSEPHYAWVYKHIGVVRYLEAHGQVDPSIDIYNRWPGFFGLGALLSVVAERPNPASYVAWADLFFLLLDSVLVMAIATSFTRSARVGACAGLVFTVTNWVGQTYYAPQAFAFALSLGALLIAFRHLVPTPGAGEFVTAVMTRLTRTSQLEPRPHARSDWPLPYAFAAIVCIDAVIVASHQLTPYVLVVDVAILMLCGVALRSWWLLGIMAAMTFGYLAANLHFVQTHYGLFSSLDPLSNTHSEYLTTNSPVPGKTFNTNAQLLLIASLWLASILALIRLYKKGLLLRALPISLLLVSPFLLLLTQNYGGEAPLRVLLFSSPWAATLIAWALLTIRSLRIRATATGIVVLCFTALFIPSYLGQEELNILSPAEVRASEHFYSHARPGSVLLLAAPGFPYRYGATYSKFAGPEGDAHPNLLTQTMFQNQPLGADHVPAVAKRIRGYAPHGYIAFSKTETTYAETFRITTPGALVELRKAVARSPEFRLWYGNRDAQIYELIDKPKRRGSP